MSGNSSDEGLSVNIEISNRRGYLKRSELRICVLPTLICDWKYSVLTALGVCLESIFSAELKIVIDQCLVSCLYKDQVSHLGGLNRP